MDEMQIKALLAREGAQPCEQKVNLKEAMTFNGKAVDILRLSELEDLVLRLVDDDFKHALLEFLPAGYLGLVESDKVQTGASYRFRVNFVSEDEKPKLFIAYPLDEAEPHHPLNLRMNEQDPQLYTLMRTGKYYPAKSLHFMIKSGDEFNMIVGKIGSQGDYISNLSRVQRAIIKDSAVPLQKGYAVRIKVLRVRGTQYFVKAVGPAYREDMQLSLTREIPYRPS